MLNPDVFPKTESCFFIKGPVGRLELLTTYPSQKTQRVVVICHPHPLYQGTMNNKVVTTLAKSFDELGLATVRFNFRGVGKSAGSSTGQALAESEIRNYEHAGELDDLQAVLEWVKESLAGAKFWLAGFSFGSYVAAKLAETWPTEQLISIAPPVERMPFADLKNIHCPWLVVQGDEDEIVSPAAVVAFAANPPSPLQLILLPGVSHFFHGRLLDLRDSLLREFNANT